MLGWGLAARGGVGRGLGVQRGAAAVPWYLSGGIDATNCIAAYDAKNAASLAASYVNLAKPGTYDAAPGVAPTWAAGTGWTFDGATQYLLTGVVPAAGWSFLIRFSGMTGSDRFVGAFVGSPANSFYLSPYYGGTGKTFYRIGSGYKDGSSAYVAAGVMGISSVAGTGQGYLNGLADGGTFVPGTNTGAMSIGRLGMAAYWLPGVTIAYALWNIQLSPAQMLAVSTAMAAL